MKELEKVICEMDFKYFGTGQHKIDPEVFFALDNNIFLDIRAKEEVETVKFSLSHYCTVLEIPTNEVPLNLYKIPKDKTIGVFCSSGVRAVIIFTYLRTMGYEKVKVIAGGYVPLMAAIMPGKLYKRIKK